MEKIRVQNRGQYEIEVNDKGETIVLNLDDTRLLGKLLNMIKDINEKQSEFEAKIKEITEREDKPVEGFEDSEIPITQNFVDYIKLTDDFCVICRGYVDDLFGEGASMKIFGESNRIDMFEDFIVALEPILEKNKVNMQNMKKGLVEKYKKDDGDVI